jgi:hypothetical protein
MVLMTMRFRDGYIWTFTIERSEVDHYVGFAARNRCRIELVALD